MDALHARTLVVSTWIVGQSVGGLFYAYLGRRRDKTFRTMLRPIGGRLHSRTRARSIADKCAVHTPYPGVCTAHLRATLQLHPAEHSRSPTHRRTPSPPGCRLSYGPSAPGQRRRRAGGAWLVEAVHGAYPPGEEAASRRHLDVAPRSATTSASEWCTCAEQAARASPSSAEPARTTY